MVKLHYYWNGWQEGLTAEIAVHVVDSVYYTLDTKQYLKWSDNRWIAPSRRELAKAILINGGNK